ncbi:hypothetical protein DYGSA30_07100 [Dyella sp. GSA-30]|nr:hypothetical protein DYGSA30_07100 [Dyella sp. GSA-30]
MGTQGESEINMPISFLMFLKRPVVLFTKDARMGWAVTTAGERVAVGTDARRQRKFKRESPWPDIVNKPQTIAIQP